MKKKFLSTTLFTLCSLAYAEVTYSTLENLSIPVNKALTLNSDNTLSFSRVTGLDNQKWAFIKAEDTGYWYLKNKTNSNLCLNSTNNLYQSCTQGGYSTQRKFFPQKVGNSKFIISNQYKSQTGQPSFLATNTTSLSITYLKAESSNIDEVTWEFNGQFDQYNMSFLGNKKVLLVNAYFSGQKPRNGTNVYNAVFKNKDNKLNLQENIELSSGGRATISGEFLDNIELKSSPLVSCSSDERNEKIFNPIKEIAKGQGIEYEYIFVELPPTKVCKYGAVAQKVGNGKTVHSNGEGHKYWMWNHELGHNLGGKHTKSLTTETVNNSTVKLLNSLKTGWQLGIDYGDTLGGGGRGLFAVNYRLWLGWIDPQDVPYIQSKGIYTLLPAFSSQKGNKGLRIARKDSTVLVIEYRPNQGKYDQFSSQPNQTISNGLTIRHEKIVSAFSLEDSIIDTTPSTDSKDSPLTIGRTLIDELSGYSIKVLSIDENSGVKVEIN